MAKRRLNTRFVGIFAGCALGVLALGAGGLFVKHRYFREKPDKYIAIGKQALEAGDYEKARTNLGHALGLSPPSAVLDTLLGDAVSGLSSKESDYVRAARQLWDQAVGIDPTYVPALERLVQFWDDDLSLCIRTVDRTNAAEQLAKAADKLVEVAPTDPIGQRARAQAVIEIMLNGRPTPPSRLNEAEDQLLKLQETSPEDASLPFWVARSRLHQAMDAARSEDSSSFDSDMHVAESVMLDAIRNQPNNASMAYHTGQILLQMASIDQKLEKPWADIKALVERANEQVNRARELVKPDNPEYIDINLYNARLVLDQPDSMSSTLVKPLGGNPTASDAMAVPTIAENPLAQTVEQTTATHRKTPQRVLIAEQIYRDVLSHRPNDPYTAMALARLLGDIPGRRPEAIALLSKPFTDDHPVPGIKGTLLPLLQSESDTTLLGLKLDEADATRDKAKRDALIATCIPLSEKIIGKAPDSPSALGLKGRLELIQNHLVSATQTLRQALGLIDANNLQLDRTRYELTFYLARAYELAQQTGDAKKLALDVAKMYPDYIPARLMLARLFIAENDFEAAKGQIDKLAALAGDNPSMTSTILHLRLQCVDGVKDPNDFAPLYAQLPETTRNEQLEKAGVAHRAKMDDEALRLLNLILAKSPGDAQAAQAVVSIYASRGEMDHARHVIDVAVATTPSDLTLLSMKMRLEGKSQDEIDAAMEKLGAAPAERMTAFSQEMADAKVARQRGDLAGVDRHLAIAEKLKPEDAHLWDALFVRCIETANWEKAETYVEKLAANNVDQTGGQMYRIRLAVAQNDLSKALQLALSLARDKQEFSQSWCVLGDVQRAMGKYDDATHSYQFALERQVQNLDALRGLVQCSYALDKNDSAKEYIAQGRKIDPQNAEFRELELSHELTYGDPQKVIQPRIDAVKAAPTDPRALLNLASTYVAAAQARTIARDSSGATQDYVSAEQTLRDGITRFPTDERFPLQFSKVALYINDFAAADQVMQAYASRPEAAGLPATAILLSDFYDHAGKADLAINVLQGYVAKPAKPTNVEADVNVELRLSTLLARAGRIDDALASLSSNSTEPIIVRQKIALLINSNRLLDADKALAIEASRGPLTTQLQNLQGMLQLAENQPAAARQTFDRLLAQHPDDVDALLQRSKMALSASLPNIRSAEADLTHARDVDPRNVEARTMLAQLDRDKGDLLGATKELESGLQAIPTDKKLRLALVDLYASQEHWDDAVRVLHQASLIPELASDPDFIRASAVISMGRNEYPQAEAEINEALAKSPGNLEMIHTDFDILLREKASGQLMNQSDDLLASRNNDPSLWWVYEYRARARLIDSPDKAAAADELQHGLAAATAGHNDAALAALMNEYRTLLGGDAALRLATDKAAGNGHWQLIAADLCKQQDDAAGAVHWYEEALKHFDTLSSADQSRLLTSAAVEYQKLSPPDMTKAADLYRRLIAINPGDVLSLNNLACMLAEPGSESQHREALDYGQRAYNAMIQSGSDEPQIKDTYGWTLIANGRMDEGSSLVQDAISKQDFPEAHYHLAEALLNRSPPDPDDAVSELTKALRMLDNDEHNGKVVDQTLRGRLQQELKRARASGTG